jgi:hypothetical protein
MTVLLEEDDVLTVLLLLLLLLLLNSLAVHLIVKTDALDGELGGGGHSIVGDCVHVLVE